jgi:hypothetical protein
MIARSGISTVCQLFLAATLELRRVWGRDVNERQDNRDVPQQMKTGPVATLSSAILRCPITRSRRSSEYGFPISCLPAFQYDVLNPIRARRGIPPDSFFSGSALID